MRTITVAFFGHLQIKNHKVVRERLENALSVFFCMKNSVIFLVGKSSDFDQLAAEVLVRVKERYGSKNNSNVLVLPFETMWQSQQPEEVGRDGDGAELDGNPYTERRKPSAQMRNYEIVDHADVIFSWITSKTGSAQQIVKYAERNGKIVINLAELI